MDTETAPAHDTNAEAAIVAIWRRLDTDAKSRLTSEARELVRADAERSASHLFAEWWAIDRAEPASSAEETANNDRMREIAACLCAAPIATPADLARAIIVGTYHGSFVLDGGNVLLSRCYALAGVPLPSWCRVDNAKQGAATRGDG